MGMHKSASTGSGMNMGLDSSLLSPAGRGMTSSQSQSSSLAGLGPVPKSDPFAELSQS